MKKMSLIIMLSLLISLLAGCVETPSTVSSSSENTSTATSTPSSSSQATSSVSSIDTSSTSSITSSNKVSSQNTSSKAAASSTSTSSKTTSSEVIVPTGQPLPPVSKELQQLYLKGLEIYKWFYSAAIYADNCPTTKDGYKVPNINFKDYEDLFNYVQSAYWNGYIEERLLTHTYFNNSNGMPDEIKKCIERAKYYENHCFEKVSETQDEIKLRVLVTFNENGTKYQANYPLIFERMDNTWMITDFYLWCPPNHIEDNYSPVS